MRVCLIGGGGFLGSHVAERLLREPAVSVVVADTGHGRIEHLLALPRFTYYDTDLQHDRELLMRLVSSADVVVKLVRVDDEDPDVDPADVFDAQVRAHVDIVRACARAACRVVHVSSGAVYGPSWLSLAPPGVIDPALLRPEDLEVREDDAPLITTPVQKPGSIITAGKLLLERSIVELARREPLEYTIVRPFNVVGPGAPPAAAGSPVAVLQRLVSDAVLGRALEVPESDDQVTFLHVLDAADAIARVVLDEDELTSGQIVNVAHPSNVTTYRQLAGLIASTAQSEFELGALDAAPLATGGSVLTTAIVPSIAKARNLLGWEPERDLVSIVRGMLGSRIGPGALVVGGPHASGSSVVTHHAHPDGPLHGSERSRSR